MRRRLLISAVLSAVLLCTLPTTSDFAQASRPNSDIVSPMYQIAENPKSDGFAETCTVSVVSSNA